MINSLCFAIDFSGSDVNCDPFLDKLAKNNGADNVDKLLSDKKAIALFVLPGLVLFLGIVFVPVVWSFVYSLYDGVPGLKFTFNGIDNYMKLFKDKQFFQSFVITLKYMVFMCMGEISFALLLSFLFSFFIKRYTTLARTVVFFPVVLPIVAVGQLFTKIYDITPYYGLVNSILDAIGLDSLIKPWIGTPSTALGALLVQDIWKGMGFYAIIFYAAIVAISKEIFESAEIDGANGRRLIWNIVLPLLKPVIATCMILSLSGTLKVYASPLALTQGGPGKATYMLSMYMYDSAFLFNKYGYGSSIAIFILLECIFVTLVVKNFFSSKENI